MADRPPGFFEGTEMPTAGWWEALWPDPFDVLRKLGLQPGLDVVDLCSGDGWFTLQLAKLANHVVAIDIDPSFLEIARQRLAESRVKTCEFVVGDAYDISELANPADFVFMANAFHGVPDRARLTKAVRSVLKPGGQFAVVNWHQRPREQTTVLGEPRGPKTGLRMSPAETIAAVERGGLTHVKTVEVSPYHYGAIFRKSAD